MIDVKRVGAFIAECRKEHNWTQKQLGEQLGVTDRAVSKWETGRSLPDISLMEPICNLFGITVGELLSGKRMEKEEVQKETEQILIKSIGENQLFGFQIVLHLLTLCSYLLFLIPFLKDTGTLFPGFTFINIICWVDAIILLCCTEYLDRHLPARKYRYSNTWIETARGTVMFLLLVAYSTIGRRGINSFVASFTEASIGEKMMLCIVFAICLIAVITAGIKITRQRRREYNHTK